MDSEDSKPHDECGYCGGTGEVACSSTSYMACPECVARRKAAGGQQEPPRPICGQKYFSVSTHGMLKCLRPKGHDGNHAYWADDFCIAPMEEPSA